MKVVFSLLLASLILLSPLQGQFESDVLKTSQGELEMFFIGHGTLMFTYQDLVIHIDPVSREADYSTLPDADLILVTHQHGDHLDKTAINQLLKSGTSIVMTETCLAQLEDFKASVMKNGDIIEQGNHDSLMAQGGHYAELYNTYFRHQSLAYIESVGQRKAA